MSIVQDNFKIFVALPTDDVFTVKGLLSKMLVCELKSRIELRAGIPGDIFSLFFMNVELLDEGTLKTYNLKHGCIVRVKIEQNWIGLFEACWRGDIYDVFENGVQFLDENKFEGYNISLWNKLVIRRATHALFIACHRGYLGLILELINRGATDINGKTIFGRSALHVAAYQGFVGCVSLLLSEGAVCNQTDIQGKTPLALAGENGHVYCERRLWLYQWSVQTFRQPSRRCNRELSESSENGERNDRHSKNLTKLPSTSRTTEELDHNNNNGQEKTAASDRLDLPRVINDDGKRHIRRSNSYEPPRSPLPFAQVAEKYRKEFQEYNEGTLHLPTETENGFKKEEVMEDQDIKVPDMMTRLTNEAEIVGEANNNHDIKSGVGDLKREIENNTLSIEEKSDDKTNKEIHTNKRHNEDQGQDNRITDESKPQEQESRPVSGRSNGIRKLDILMTETRAEKLRTVSSSYEQDKLHAWDRDESEREPEVHQGSTLINLGKEYSCKKAAQSFEDWLQMKRSQEKNRPSTAPTQKSRLGKSIDPESFKKWLSSKRHQRTQSNSESSSSNKKTFISSGGLTFEQWLETKLSNRPFSAMSYVTETRDTTPGTVNKVRKQIVSGKPFGVWLAEKKTLEQSIHGGENDSEQGKKNSKSGKKFEVWLQEKNKQKQIELVQKLTTEKEEQRLAEIDKLQKWLNPRYKTYEDWLAIKNHQARFERLRTQSEPQKQQEQISEEEKQKDAKVVYDIWQTMKALQELSDEERKYKEMKAKWAAKQLEKEHLRRLNVLNKARQFHVRSTSAKT